MPRRMRCWRRTGGNHGPQHLAGTASLSERPLKPGRLTCAWFAEASAALGWQVAWEDLWQVAGEGCSGVDKYDSMIVLVSQHSSHLLFSAYDAVTNMACTPRNTANSLRGCCFRPASSWQRSATARSKTLYQCTELTSALGALQIKLTGASKSCFNSSGFWEKHACFESLAPNPENQTRWQQLAEQDTTQPCTVISLDGVTRPSESALRSGCGDQAEVTPSQASP